MGVDDLMAARNMVMAAMKTTELKRIDYQTFNSLQKVDNSAVESRYNTLLQRVGTTVSFDPDLVKMLSYVLLFSIDFTESDPNVRRLEKRPWLLLTAGVSSWHPFLKNNFSTPTRNFLTFFFDHLRSQKTQHWCNFAHSLGNLIFYKWRLNIFEVKTLSRYHVTWNN